MGADRQSTFTVAENYQSVYRRIIEQERKCYQRFIIGAQIVVQGDIYNDIKKASITTAVHGSFGVDQHRVIDISAIDDKSTKITAYHAYGPVAKWGKILTQWVDGSTECDLK